MAHGHGGQQAQGGDSPYCSFHPRELVVGVCAHCLRDRLLLLLAASAATNNNNNKDDEELPLSSSRFRRRTSSISFPKVLALGSSFLQRLDSRHHHEADAPKISSDDDTASVASLDDSFISIKFEDNGKATWDKQQALTAAPVPVVRSSSSSSTAVVAVVEHVKRGGVTRWRKQVVGRLLQLARWKRSAAVVVVGMDGKKAAAAERSKARGGRGWIRSLTRRRAWS
ncbi:hypothetical protein PR202_ga18481 [Eleusine coracana subsp. coracana]|uniref:Uncharacterized protein n=1 Tax=Eleusine coracana subsp. coracana TaxID=191504 RepID=A0AAV5CSY1_ELECO|nr:hypothetical protein QOZ80_4AG0298360 [Eleusine coracana subsp. coracana]GJN01233.1 hypothetical protein PR202_ga18481 [Eleusine coracana subsp. coracana]